MEGITPPLGYKDVAHFGHSHKVKITGLQVQMLGSSLSSLWCKEESLRSKMLPSRPDLAQRNQGPDLW